MTTNNLTQPMHYNKVYTEISFENWQKKMKWMNSEIIEANWNKLMMEKNQKITTTTEWKKTKNRRINGNNLRAKWFCVHANCFNVYISMLYITVLEVLELKHYTVHATFEKKKHCFDVINFWISSYITFNII